MRLYCNANRNWQIKNIMFVVLRLSGLNDESITGMMVLVQLSKVQMTL